MGTLARKNIGMAKAEEQHISCESTTSDAVDIDGICPRVTEMLQTHRDKIKEDKLSNRQLRSLQSSIGEDAAQAYRTQDFEVALNLFTKYLACVEAYDPTDKDTRAAIISNIGSSLHNMEDYGPAEEFYTAGIRMFEQIQTGRLTWLFYGDVNAKRLEYMKARVGELSQRQRPDLQKYLDGNGREQKWTKSEMTPGSPQWSWYNPYSWYQWYHYNPLPDNGPEPETMTKA